MPDLPGLEVILNSRDSRQWEELMLKQEEENEYRAGFKRHDPAVEIPEKVDREEEARLGGALFEQDREQEARSRRVARKLFKKEFNRLLGFQEKPEETKAPQ